MSSISRVILLILSKIRVSSGFEMGDEDLGHPRVPSVQLVDGVASL